MDRTTATGIVRLHQHVGAEVTGVDLSQPISDRQFDEIIGALDEHSMLVFRDQQLDDVAQVAFASRFGRLEKTRLGAVGEGGDLVVLSNLDATGRVVSADNKQLFDTRANQLWHSDASFRPVPAYASVLSGRKVAPAGGETEFVSTRYAYEALPAHRQEELRELHAIHHFAHSRSLIEPGRLARAEADHLPAVKHPLVRRHSRTGKPALFIGSHLREFLDLSPEESSALLEELTRHATRPECIYSHQWRPFDLLVWDNSAVMHRGRPWDESMPRYMKRATVADDGYQDGELVAA